MNLDGKTGDTCHHLIANVAVTLNHVKYVSVFGGQMHPLYPVHLLPPALYKRALDRQSASSTNSKFPVCCSSKEPSLFRHLQAKWQI